MTFYVDTTSITGGGLIKSTTDTTPVRFQGFARTAEAVPIVVQPVTVTGINTTSADFASTDTLEVFAGPADDAPTGGTFTLTLGATTTAALDYNISKSALQTAFAALCTTEGKAAPTVDKVSNGVWRITGNTDGAIGATGNCTINAEQLEPTAYGSVMETNLGSATAPYSLLVVIRISPLVYQSTFTITTPNYTGTLTLNTVELFEYSQRQKDNPFYIPFSIRRTRTSGEVNTIFGPINIPIYKESLNPLTATPTQIPSSGGGSSALSVGNSLFVDVDGSDSTGTRERFDKPFLTFSAAKTASVSGDAVFVRPGTFTEVNILKAGVNLDLSPGTVIRPSLDSQVGIIDDTSGALSARICGDALMSNDGTSTAVSGINGRVLHLADASSVVYLSGDAFEDGSSTSNFYDAVLSQENGTSYNRGASIDGGANNALYWAKGPMYCSFLNLVGGPNGVFAVGSPSPNGEFYVDSQKIESIDTGGAAFNATGAIDPRNWIRAAHLVGEFGVFLAGCVNYITSQKIDSDVVNSQAVYVVNETAAPTNFIETQRLRGQIAVDDGVTDLRILALHDDLGSTAAMAVVNGGTLRLHGGYFKAVTMAGFSVGASGTVRLMNMTIDTSAVAGTKPISGASGAVIVLHNVHLQAHAAADSIGSTSGTLTVICLGTCTTNRTVGANVTLVGNLTVNASFA